MDNFQRNEYISKFYNLKTFFKNNEILQKRLFRVLFTFFDEDTMIINNISTKEAPKIYSLKFPDDEISFISFKRAVDFLNLLELIQKKISDEGDLIYISVKKDTKQINKANKILATLVEKNIKYSSIKRDSTYIIFGIDKANRDYPDLYKIINATKKRRVENPNFTRIDYGVSKWLCIYLIEEIETNGFAILKKIYTKIARTMRLKKSTIERSANYLLPKILTSLGITKKRATKDIFIKLGLKGDYRSLTIIIPNDDYNPSINWEDIINDYDFNETTIDDFKNAKKSSLKKISTNNQNPSNYYVYFHKLKSKEMPFYIGKGFGDRAFSFRFRNEETIAMWEKYDCESVIIKDNLTESEALVIEKSLIETYSKITLLTNRQINKNSRM